MLWIRNDFGRLDRDPRGKMPQKKEKSEGMYCLEVLYVLFRAGSFPVAAIKDLQATGKDSSHLKSSWRSRYKYHSLLWNPWIWQRNWIRLNLKCWIRFRIVATADSQHCFVDPPFIAEGCMSDNGYLVAQKSHILVWWPRTTAECNFYEKSDPHRHDLSVVSEDRGIVIFQPPV